LGFKTGSTTGEFINYCQNTYVNKTKHPYILKTDYHHGKNLKNLQATSSSNHHLHSRKQCLLAAVTASKSCLKLKLK
jgi:hypothetical protein